MSRSLTISRSTSLVRFLAADPLVAAAAVGLALLCLVLVFLPTQQTLLARRLASVAFVLLAFFALRPHSRSHDREERGFWRDLQGAMGCWLVVTGMWLVAQRGPLVADLIWEGFYALVYVFFFLAIERQPHRQHRWRPNHLERSLNVPTVLAVVFGLFLYFPIFSLLIGDEGSPEQLSTWVYLTIDAYLCLRVLILLRGLSSPRWRAIYGCLALSVLVMLANHLMDIYALENPTWRLLANLTWKVPSIALLIAARVSLFPFPPEPGFDVSRVRIAGNLPGPLGHTVIFAVAFPLMHYGAKAVGASWLEGPPGEGAREILVTGWIVLLGAWAIFQYNRLDRALVRLWRERQQTERALRRVEGELQLRAEHQELALAERRSRERFAEAFHACPDAMGITRLDINQVIELGPNIVHITGYTATELLGGNVLDLGIWATPEDREAMLRELVRRGTVLDYEARFRHKCGEISRGLYSAALVEIGRVPYLFSITRSVTAERAEESDFERRLAAFQEVSCAVVLLDGEGRIVHWSRRAEELLGWPEPAVLHRTARFFAADEVLLEKVSQARRGIGEVRTLTGARRLIEGLALPLGSGTLWLALRASAGVDLVTSAAREEARE